MVYNKINASLALPVTVPEQEWTLDTDPSSVVR